tara:strand:- start:11665 stop:12042 length:378 start_codon:yes stop_codon:yes gene_type:complete
MNSIESNFVPYQIALDMKSIGFDKPNYFLKWYDSKGNIREGLGLGEVKAPLYQQAFRWFREKYDLHSGIDNSISGYYGITKKRDVKSSLYLSEWVNTQEFPFKTHEEAELACLIKLIEIVKEKKQ